MHPGGGRAAGWERGRTRHGPSGDAKGGWERERAASRTSMQLCRSRAVGPVRAPVPNAARLTPVGPVPGSVGDPKPCPLALWEVPYHDRSSSPTRATLCIGLLLDEPIRESGPHLAGILRDA